MTLDQVKDLVTFAKAQGATSFRYGDLEVSFGPEPVQVPESPKDEKPKTAEDMAKAEEDLLYMSAGG